MNTPLYLFPHPNSFQNNAEMLTNRKKRSTIMCTGCKKLFTPFQVFYDPFPNCARCHRLYVKSCSTPDCEWVMLSKEYNVCPCSPTLSFCSYCYDEYHFEHQNYNPPSHNDLFPDFELPIHNSYQN